MGKEYENLKKQRCLQLVQECARSGKSKREWCVENGIGYSTFMRWQRQLREELAGAVLASQEIVPVQVELPERFSRWNTGSATADAAGLLRLHPDRRLFRLPLSGSRDPCRLLGPCTAQMGRQTALWTASRYKEADPKQRLG